MFLVKNEKPTKQKQKGTWSNAYQPLTRNHTTDKITTSARGCHMMSQFAPNAAAPVCTQYCGWVCTQCCGSVCTMLDNAWEFVDFCGFYKVWGYPQTFQSGWNPHLFLVARAFCTQTPTPRAKPWAKGLEPKATDWTYICIRAYFFMFIMSACCQCQDTHLLVCYLIVNILPVSTRLKACS